MGDCEDAVHRLYHFLDGELDDARRADIKRHLDECLPCLEAFDFEAELRIVIAQRCRDEVPEGLRDRIAQAIQHEHLGPSDGGGIPRL
jgi:mycothiol system anti-sigma-R factor